MAQELEGRVQDLEKSIGSIESQVRAQIAKAESGTRVVLVIGIIVIVVIFGYLMWLSNLIKRELKPDLLAETMTSQVEKNIAPMLDKLEAVLKEEAPANIEKIRKQVMAQVPILRDMAEKRADEMIDKFSAELDARVNAIVGELLSVHKGELDPLIETAATPGGAEKLQEAFTKSLEELIAPKLDEVLVQYDQMMNILNWKLTRLLDKEAKLSPEEMLEKELITAMIVYINDVAGEQVKVGPGPSPAASGAPAVLGGSGETK